MILLIILSLLAIFPVGYSQSFLPFSAVEGEMQHVDVFAFDYEKGHHTIELAMDAQGVPQYYYANLVTPVCDDSVCEVMHLKMYWDLLGNYMSFDTLSGFTLTKYNHVAFTEAEYIRLDHILQDGHSPLGELQMGDLVNHDMAHISGAIDAISGATNIDISTSVITGAVYTCYTLWHIAHLQTADTLLTHTTSLLNDDLIRAMLASQHSPYQLYVLGTFSAYDYVTYQFAIEHLISLHLPPVMTYLMDNLPDEVMALAEIQNKMSSEFSKFSITVRYRYLSRLLQCHCIYPSSLELLSTQINVMSYMQVQNYADLLKRNSTVLTADTVENIEKLVNSATYQYAFVLTEALPFLLRANVR